MPSATKDEPSIKQVLVYAEQKTGLAFGRNLNIPPCSRQVVLEGTFPALENALRRYYAELKILEGRAVKQVAEKMREQGSFVVIDD
jgi:hypothetical protein